MVKLARIYFSTCCSVMCMALAAASYGTAALIPEVAKRTCMFWLILLPLTGIILCQMQWVAYAWLDVDTHPEVTEMCIMWLPYWLGSWLFVVCPLAYMVAATCWARSMQATTSLFFPGAVTGMVCASLVPLGTVYGLTCVFDPVPYGYVFVVMRGLLAFATLGCAYSMLSLTVPVLTKNIVACVCLHACLTLVGIVFDELHWNLMEMSFLENGFLTTLGYSLLACCLLALWYLILYCMDVLGPYH